MKTKFFLIYIYINLNGSSAWLSLVPVGCGKWINCIIFFFSLMESHITIQEATADEEQASTGVHQVFVVFGINAKQFLGPWQAGSMFKVSLAYNILLHDCFALLTPSPL